MLRSRSFSLLWKAGSLFLSRPINSSRSRVESGDSPRSAQEIDEGAWQSAALPAVNRRIERHLGPAAGEALLHLDHVLFAHVELLGEELGPGQHALGLEPLLLAHEMIEELLLRLRGADLHEAEVI